MPKPRNHPKLLIQTAGLALVLLCVAPAGADWVITEEGRLIETQGPWEIDGTSLTYTDLEGVETTLALAEVDLEASEETTALKAGRPYVAKEKPIAPAAAEPEADDGEPKITLYMTSWCGYCRKASKLLTRLDADFVAKNIEKDGEAAAEYREKSGGRAGVPLIDFDGRVVRGYNERLIRQLVRELQKPEAEAASSPES